MQVFHACHKSHNHAKGCFKLADNIFLCFNIFAFTAKRQAREGGLQVTKWLCAVLQRGIRQDEEGGY